MDHTERGSTDQELQNDCDTHRDTSPRYRYLWRGSYRRAETDSDMSTEQDAATPAAAVLERRQRRTTPQKRKQVCSDSDSEESETGSDGEWSGDDDPLSDHGREDEDED